MSGTTSIQNKLTGYEFHSYLDGQTSAEEIERIEEALSKNPKIVLQLQQCIMINERFQELYSEPVTGPLQSSEHIATQPVFHEPELVNQDIEAEDALVAVDALDLNTQEGIDYQPDNIANEYHSASVTEFPGHEHDEYVEDDYVDDVPTLDQEPSLDQHVLHDLEDEPEEEIQVENLLQGISEVEELSERQDDPLVAEMYGMEVYTHPDRGWFSDLLHRAKDTIRAKINLYRYKIQQKRLAKLMNDAELQEDFVDDGVAASEFDIDIDHAIQETPKWKFWSKQAKVVDDFYDYGDDDIPQQPFGQEGKLSRLKNSFYSFLTLLHIPQHRHNQIGVAGMVLLSFLIGGWISSAPIAMDASALMYQAIEGHQYYASRNFEPLQHGIINIDDDLNRMNKSVGAKLPMFSLKDSGYKRVGFTLVPTIIGYAGLQVLENRNKQYVSIFATAWHDPSMPTHRVSCKVPSLISSACTWQDDDFYYIATSDISLSRVRLISENFASQRP